MNKETFGIGILSFTALLLLIANYFATPQANAAAVIKDRDYQMATVYVQQGGEGLYVLDGRNGTLTVFTYDVNSRRLMPRVTRSLSEVFSAPAR